MKPIKTKDKTVLRALGLGGYFGGGAEGMVDVKDGKIVRERPMQYGWKYDKSEVRQWKITRDGKSIEPIGESKSDSEIVYEISKKIEDLEEDLTEGMTILDMQKKIWEYMGGEKLVSWEQLWEKKYWIYNTAEDWEKDSPGFRNFYNDPAQYPLATPTGKLEFYSEALAKAYPDDKERPPIPKWIEKSHNLNIAQKCTSCAHLRDSDPDEWLVPRCVDQCPTDALRFGEEAELADFIKAAETLNPEAGTKSRVYYQHLPKKFVAGTVYDPVEKEVIIGAQCTLKDAETGETFAATTDNFGDFWFRGLADDRSYSLTIEKEGASKTIDDIVTDKDLSLGDIPMG
jgi:ferredoxin